MKHSSKHRRQQSNRKAFMLLAISGTAFFGAIAVAVTFQPIAQNKTTNCPVDVQLSSQTFIVIDRTDPWPAVQTSLLKTAILSMAKRVEMHNRFVLITFDGQAQKPATALFDRCNPGTGKKANVLTTTISAIKRAYAKTYITPLQEALLTATTSTEAKKTHLVAFLSNLAAHVHHEAQARQSTIVVFSDMAENNKSYSVYRQAKRHSSHRAFVAHFRSLTRDRLIGISLNVQQLQLPDQSTGFTNKIRKVWMAAFKDGDVSYQWRRF